MSQNRRQSRADRKQRRAKSSKTSSDSKRDRTSQAGRSKQSTESLDEVARHKARPPASHRTTGSEAERRDAVRPGKLEQAPWYREFLATHGFWIAGVLLLAYTLSFISRPLPDLTVDGDADFKIYRFTVIDLVSRMPPAQYVEGWTGGKLSGAAIGERLRILVGVMAITGLAWGMGRLTILSVGGCGLFNRLEVHLFASAIGWQAMSLLTLLVGLVGGISALGLLAGYGTFLIAIGLLAARRKLRMGGGVKSGAVACETRAPGASEAHSETMLLLIVRRMCVVGVAGFSGWLLLGAMMPPLDFDVLEYHLQVPKEWYQAGRIGFVEHNVYGNMPLGAEILSIPAMVFSPDEPTWWWGAVIGKTVMGLFAIATAMLLFCAGRRLISTTAGTIAALLYLSTPWVLKTAFLGWNENAFAFYFFASFYLVLFTLRDIQDLASRKALVQLGLAGFLAGGAVSTKYPALLFVVMPLLIAVISAPWWRHRVGWPGVGSGDTESRPQLSGAQSSGAQSPGAKPSGARTSTVPAIAWKACFGFLLLALISCGPWFAKNAVLAGNPTYPLLSDTFGSRTAEQNEQWRNAHRMTDKNGFTPARWWSDMDSVFIGSQWLSLPLIPLALFAWTLPRYRGFVFFSFATLLFVIACWWLLTHRIERFLVPTYPVFALLGGVAVAGQVENKWRGLLAFVLGIGVMINLIFAFSPQGILSGDQRFLASYELLQQPDSPLDVVHREIDRQVKPGQKVLLVGDAIPFDLRVNAIYNTCFDQCQLERLTKDRDAREQLASLQAEQVSVVFVHWQELERYRSPGSYGYSEYVTPAVIGQMVKDRVLIPIEIEMPTAAGQLFRVGSDELAETN